MFQPQNRVDSSHRRIAPLPSRPKSGSSDQSRKSPAPMNVRGASLEAPVDATPARRHSYHCPAATLDAPRLSPSPAGQATQPGPTFQFRGVLSTEQQESFTFRVLHNVTPRPSPQPEENSYPSLETVPIELDPSSLPILLEDQATNKDHTVETTCNLPELLNPPEAHFSSRIRTVSDFSLPSLSFTETESSNSSLTPRSRRVSDVSIVSVRDDLSTVYEVRDEEAPVAPFFSPTFQAALKKGLDIAKRSAAAMEKLKSLLDPGSHFERLLTDSKRLSTFQFSDARTIAFMGDSGQGKSSLINSLLHFQDIAATGDLGAACTSVVTEYRQRTVDQKEPITIEVDYLSGSEIEDLVKELVWNYRQIFLPEIEEDKVDARDYARYQRESEQAWSALEAGFKHQRAFKKEFLSDMSDGSLERVTNQLIQWARDIEWPEGGSAGRWMSTAQTAEECYEKTSTFMRDRYWPFTKIIRIYVDALVLKTGLVLADLPGLQDTNLARVQATQKYLMKCDHVFVVANISRAITDQSLKSSLYAVLARHVPLEWEQSAGRSLNLAVVCTKSEDINEKTARREFCGPGKRISQSVMDELDRNIERARSSGDQALKKTLKRRRELLLIDARNSHVKEGLQAAYASKVPGGQLEVFCVSNTMYEKFTKRGNSDMIRSMVSSSGIPELRRFCHSITADARLLEAKHFLQSTLSSLLNSIEVWANAAPVRLDADDDGFSIELDTGAIKEVGMEILRIVRQSRKDFDDSFRESILEFLHHRNHHWEDSAEKKGREWFSWHWTQYNAWCLNNGNHATARREATNWNGELIWKMRMELEYQWDILLETIPAVFTELLDSLKSRFQALKSLLRDHGFSSTFIDSIEFRIHDIEYYFGLEQRAFEHEVRLVRAMASEPNTASYIVREMIPAYRAASQESGTGKAARQRSRVQGRITNGTLFPNISTSISSSIKKAVQKTFRRMRKIVEENFDRIMDDIDMVVMQHGSEQDEEDDEGGEEREEDYEEEERLRTDLAHEVQELKKEHGQVLERISQL